MKYDRRQVQTFAAQGDLHRKSINVAVSWPGILQWFQFWPPREQLSMVINPALLHGMSPFPREFPVLCVSFLMGGSYCGTPGNSAHPLRKLNRIKTSCMLQGTTVSWTRFCNQDFLETQGSRPCMSGTPNVVLLHPLHNPWQAVLLFVTTSPDQLGPHLEALLTM